ncbi:GNAT family N-acetyltransferase [Tenacibaculum todarodis]|uniref:GNAT family N-acetyltransferase n=1 Tax=Tenacibaculum todarodis TaxID=1850252 RepID=A0A1L3JGE2_9FLAO|nr:GNAT family N-acetyltransferase [Tenacibaculum todarodis]APG64192.1 GNAT family N-acetyltransferase [Tenacibaculum todarodis]
MSILIEPIASKDILQIMPLLQKLNIKTPKDILEKRVKEMASLANYECIGLFLNNQLVGISGLWYSTRHYIGKSAEPDHVIIDEVHRGKKLGKQFFSWINNYVKSKGCEAIELNTYVGNNQSHKFYYNEGYNIYGFHFLKVLREDNKFY